MKWRPDQFWEWAEKLPTSAMECVITRRHDFPPMYSHDNKFDVDRKARVVRAEAECSRCETVCYRNWTDEEFISGDPGDLPRYDYVEGYLFGHDLTPEQRRELRAEFRKRVLAEKGKRV